MVQHGADSDAQAARDARDAARRRLRQELRRRRAALPPAERRRAARLVASHLAAAGLLRPGLRIGVYLAVRSEIDLAPFIALARRAGCRLWLPRITDTRHHRMTFVPADSPLRRGPHGIPEPARGERRSAQWLQVILVPLVGFDAAGDRLGSGAGYYDRALAFRAGRRRWRGPRLIGVAHSCQRADAIAALPTDVALDAVVTEKGLFSCSGAAS
ncbi:MAG: 5-formyltetrahydrofolate cyclo-ligase [Gammaproteobacteria bacterium]